MRRKLWILGAAVMLSLATPTAAVAEARVDTEQVTTATPSASAAPASSVPEDRGTAFQATSGGTEMRDGGKLMVAAYAILWVIVAVYLGLLWSWQRKLQSRLAEIESAIDRAASKKG
jgi:hypothetical protein